MYYKCKLCPSELVVYINENDFDVIVDQLLSAAETLLIVGYLTEEKVRDETSNCYVELKCVR